MNQDDLRRAVRVLQDGDWQAAHAIVQEDEASPLACWAHGIVHILEGDLPNARYWYRAARREFPKNPVVEEEIAALRAAVDGSGSVPDS